MFRTLTPPGCEYYAGHYRGEPFRCLQFCTVRIPADPRVGAPPSSVYSFMTNLEATIRGGMAAIDRAHDLPVAQLSPELRLLNAVRFACGIFQVFLTIHPYLNGNGHAARYILWAILGRYEYWPERWPVEPRPPDPPYSKAIAAHRSGDCLPLETFVLSTIAGAVP